MTLAGGDHLASLLSWLWPRRSTRLRAWPDGSQTWGPGETQGMMDLTVVSVVRVS